MITMITMMAMKIPLLQVVPYLVGDDLPNAQSLRLERLLVLFFQEFPNVFPSHSRAGYNGAI